MMDRRTLFGTTVALAGTLASDMTVGKAEAATNKTPHLKDIEPRGTYSQGRLERLPSLDMESRLEFAQGFRKWSLREFGRAVQTESIIWSKKQASILKYLPQLKICLLRLAMT